MRLLAILAALLFSGCAAAQTITVKYASRSENLTTVDSVSAMKPCNGLHDSLVTVDMVGAIARKPILTSIFEKLKTSDLLDSSAVRLLSVIATFPKECALSMAGNVVTCSGLADSLSVSVTSSPPGSSTSTQSVVVKAP